MRSKQKFSLDHSNSTGKSCLLCHKVFSNLDEGNQLISILSDANSGLVTVAHALGTIFEVSLKFNNMIDEDLFVMCQNCARTLKELYSSFTQLLALANPEGLFRQHILKDSILWSNEKSKREDIDDIVKEEFDLEEVQGFAYDMEDPKNDISFNLNSASGSDDLINVEIKSTLTNSGDKKQSKAKSKSGKKIFKCTLCPKSYFRKRQLKYHEVKIHSKGEEQEGRTCQFCHKYFISRYIVKLHERDVHLSERVLECSHCPKKFKSKQTLNIHEKTMHSGKPKPPRDLTKLDAEPIPCPHCDKSYMTPGGLKAHLKYNHEKKFDFVCEQCGQTCTTSTQLRAHSEIHSLKRERSFKCSECGKGFMTKGTLRSHVESHTSEKSHLCSECGLGFLRSAILHKHMLAKHSILVKPKSGLGGPFKCEQCGKEFNIKDNLSQHLRSKSHGGPGFPTVVKGKANKKKGKTVV